MQILPLLAVIVFIEGVGVRLFGLRVDVVAFAGLAGTLFSWVVVWVLEAFQNSDGKAIVSFATVATNLAVISMLGAIYGGCCLGGLIMFAATLILSSVGMNNRWPELQRPSLWRTIGLTTFICGVAIEIITQTSNLFGPTDAHWLK